MGEVEVEVQQVAASNKARNSQLQHMLMPPRLQPNGIEVSAHRCARLMRREVRPSVHTNH